MRPDFTFTSQTQSNSLPLLFIVFEDFFSPSYHFLNLNKLRNKTFTLILNVIFCILYVTFNVCLLEYVVSVYLCVYSYIYLVLCVIRRP